LLLRLQERKPAVSQIPITRFLTKLAFNNVNSCYLNGLLHFLASSARLNAPETVEILQQLKPLGYDLAVLFNSINEISSEEDTQYHGDAFSVHLARANSAFREPGQKDAHEALLLMFDRLQKEQTLKEKRCNKLGASCRALVCVRNLCFQRRRVAPLLLWPVRGWIRQPGLQESHRCQT
jgi:ubiquitin C-terminal hydrolase